MRFVLGAGADEGDGSHLRFTARSNSTSMRSMLFRSESFSDRNVAFSALSISTRASCCDVSGLEQADNMTRISKAVARIVVLPKMWSCCHVKRLLLRSRVRQLADVRIDKTSRCSARPWRSSSDILRCGSRSLRIWIGSVVSRS